MGVGEDWAARLDELIAWEGQGEAWRSLISRFLLSVLLGEIPLGFAHSAASDGAEDALFPLYARGCGEAPRCTVRKSSGQVCPYKRVTMNQRNHCPFLHDHLTFSYFTTPVLGPRHTFPLHCLADKCSLRVMGRGPTPPVATRTAVYDAGFHGFGGPCAIPQPAAPIGLISVGRKVVASLSRKWIREVAVVEESPSCCLGGSVRSPYN